MFQQLKTEKILSKVLESFLIRIKLLLNELSEINLEKNVPLNHIIKKIYQIWSALADLYLGGVHKLRLQDLAFFEHLPASVYIFSGIKVHK